jgi:hypothetical protein
VFEFYDSEKHVKQLGKIEFIVKKSGEFLVCYKLLLNVKTCDNLDCFSFSQESPNSFLVHLEDIKTSRLSYVYHSIESKYVNLSVE